MRFAHIADTHLGYRQYNLDEREEDFYAAFREAVDKIIEAECDFVVHAGDLFDEPRPHIRAMLEVRTALDRLEEAGIKVFAITGNHDRMVRKGAFPPHTLYKRMNLFTLEKPWMEFEGIFICGLPYIPKSYVNVLRDKLGELSQKAKNYEKSILVLHQGIDKYIGFETAYELKIGDLPIGFDYYAMGHVHFRRADELNGGKLAYPGSTEIWRVDELGDYEKNGKGFYIIDTERFEIERVDLNVRPFISDEVKGEADVERIKEKTRGLKNPVMRLELVARASEYPRLYQELLDEFKEVLHLDIKRKMVEEEEVVSGGAVAISEMLREVMSNYSENEVGYAQDILDALSAKDLEKAKALTEGFYANWDFEDLEGTEARSKERESSVQLGQSHLGAFR